jgi:dCTP deaminase
MILTGPEIRKRIESRQIVIDPYEPGLLNPNSYNLRLHDELMVYGDACLDMKTPPTTQRLEIPADGLVLEPGRLYLGRTHEYTETHGCVPMLEGRSSVGRLGLFVHVTAGFGDVGFRGYWTLEMICVQPIRIYAGVEICQIFYHTTEGDILEYKSGKYQGNRDIQPSMLYKDFLKAPQG